MSTGSHWDTGPQSDGPYPDENTTQERVFGDDFPEYRRTATGRTVVGGDPQTVESLANEMCSGVEPATPVRTQDEFLTFLDELLDSTLHDDHCYVNPSDTVCGCIIGRIRAALPPCGAVRPAPGTNGRKVWPCIRTAHPASPDAHYFSES